MKVVCYYESLWEPNKHDDLELIGLWKESWSKQGFDPVVLGREDADRHELKNEFENCVSLHPTINDKSYEMACWRRHLAYDLSGASLFTDYDVINYTWKRDLMDDEFLGKLVHPFFRAGLFFVNREKGYRWVLDTMMHRPNIQGTSKLHSSDMTSIAGTVFHTEEIVIRDYGQPGWETSPIVHYNNGYFGQSKKAERIKQVRPLK